MSGNGAGFESVPIPADQVIHVYLPERPGQMRGIPRLASVLFRLFEFDHYEDAELVRKKAVALIGGFIIDNAPDMVPFGRDADPDPFVETNGSSARKGRDQRASPRGTYEFPS